MSERHYFERTDNKNPKYFWITQYEFLHNLKFYKKQYNGSWVDQDYKMYPAHLMQVGIEYTLYRSKSFESIGVMYLGSTYNIWPKELNRIQNLCDIYKGLEFIFKDNE